MTNCTTNPSIARAMDSNGEDCALVAATPLPLAQTDPAAARDFTGDFVEHSHPQYGSGYFCTPDVFERIASLAATPQAVSEEEGMPGILKAMKWSYDCFYVKGNNNRDERETYISCLEDDLPKLFGEVDDLSALVARLARALRKATPSNDLAEKAVDYLRRKGLQGSPLRGEAPPAPSQQAVSEVPREAIGQILAECMDTAVANGANSVSMPDYLVEVAGWLCGIPSPSQQAVEMGEREEVKRWCDTCEGTGSVYQEHQAGCHVGGDYPCPDCDGKGYWVARATLASPSSTAEGWVTVPKEPTPEMIDAGGNTAGMRAIDGASSAHQLRGNPLGPSAFAAGSPLQQAYRAMLAAAPTAPQGAQS